MKLKELIDNNTSYSTTRWAFVVCVIAAICVAIGCLVAYIVMSVFNKNCDGLLGGCTAIISVIIGIPATIKGLQGFEPRTDNQTNDTVVKTDN